MNLNANAQQITGSVVDSATKQPIEMASIYLKNNTGKLISTVFTDKLGKFAIKGIGDSLFEVSVMYVGFERRTFRSIRLTKKVDLGVINLSLSKINLNEVRVYDDKRAFINKNDKQVFKANQFASAQSGTAVDVLKNLPSVAVNSQGEITLRGSNSFLVLINGKPTVADATQVLAQLSANAIENIEIITNPSAKYDPDGKAGIINIITKKGISDGWLILANAMSGAPSLHDYNNGRKPYRFNGDFVLGYKQKKWDITLGANYLRNDAAGYREGEGYTIDKGDFAAPYQTYFPSVGERSFNRYNYAARLNTTYIVDTANEISLGLYFGRKHQDREADLNYSIRRTDVFSPTIISSNQYYNANNQAKEGKFSTGNVDYTHQFKNKSSIALSLLYEGADLYGTTTNNNLTSASSRDTIQYTFNNYTNPLSAYRVKLDYARILKTGLVEFGYQYRYDGQDGSFDYYTRVIGTNVDIRDPSFSSTVKVDNVIHSLYAQYNGQVKQWEYRGGLRYENALRKLSLGGIQQTNYQLDNLFPSAQLRYTASSHWKWKAGYSRRVKRTNNFELNPYPEREHSETLERGDAKLLPEFVSLVESGVEHSFYKGNWYATAYYQHTKNIIQRLNSLYNDTILNRIFTNASKAEQFGLEAGLNWNPVKWWQTLVGTNVFYSRVSGSIFNGVIPIDNSRIAYTINSTQTFKLPAKVAIQFSVSYMSLRPTAQGEDGAFVSPNLSIKKTSKNNAFSYQLQWLNMDAGLGISNIQRITTRGINFYTSTNYILEPDVLQLGISYTFNKKNKKVKLPSSEIGEKEF